ncbi:MAG: nitric-oxide reductase large subunit, partial [Anaeromyxobacteraceae bacterium]
MNARSKAILLFVLVGAFSVLIFGGAQINEHKPPMPAKVIDAAGQTVFTYDDIMAGQRFYLAHGGQHIGSIWGHGSYLAADWSADALHRSALVTAGLQHGLPLDAARAFTQEDLQKLETGERGRVTARTGEEL